MAFIEGRDAGIKSPTGIQLLPCLIGASLSEPHIVVISITFSCTSYRTSTSVVDPIAYSRISTWKTGILRARAGYIAPTIAPRRAHSIRPAYELTKRPGYSLLSPRALSLNLRRLSVRAVAEISMR